MFNQLAKQYIQKLIRIRTKLLKSHLNRRDETNIAFIICEFNRYLNAYDYNNWQMAGFWLSRETQIAELIPGEGSKTHDKLIGEFKKLDYQAKRIKTEKLVIHE